MLHLNHIKWAHLLWERFLKSTDWAIDATCGNGKDTQKLAELTPQGGVISIDIQQEALKTAKENLNATLSNTVHFFQQSHTTFPPLCYTVPISLIVYNLGYLPGGDLSITTQTSSTLESVKKALDLLIPKGILSITCYPGHLEGARETKAVLGLISSLEEGNFSAYQYKNLLKEKAPVLIILTKLK